MIERWWENYDLGKEDGRMVGVSVTKKETLGRKAGHREQDLSLILNLLR